MWRYTARGQYGRQSQWRSSSGCHLILQLRVFLTVSLPAGPVTRIRATFEGRSSLASGSIKITTPPETLSPSLLFSDFISHRCTLRFLFTALSGSKKTLCSQKRVHSAHRTLTGLRPSMLLGTIRVRNGVVRLLVYYGNFPPAFWELATCCMPHVPMCYGSCVEARLLDESVTFVTVALHGGCCPAAAVRCAAQRWVSMHHFISYVSFLLRLAYASWVPPPPPLGEPREGGIGMEGWCPCATPKFLKS